MTQSTQRARVTQRVRVTHRVGVTLGVRVSLCRHEFFTSARKLGFAHCCEKWHTFRVTVKQNQRRITPIVTNGIMK